MRRKTIAVCGLMLFFLSCAGCQPKADPRMVAVMCNGIVSRIYGDIMRIRYKYPALENFGPRHLKEAPLEKPAGCIGDCGVWEYASISYQGQVMRRMRNGNVLEMAVLSIGFTKRPYDPKKQYVEPAIRVHIKSMDLYLQGVVRTSNSDLQAEVVEIIKKDAQEK